MGILECDGLFCGLTSKCRLAVKKLGIDAAREATKKQILDLKFEPKGDTSLDSPKLGKEDPKNEAHTGGNTWAGGVSIDQFFCVPSY